jgi:hypothetical protein
MWLANSHLTFWSDGFLRARMRPDCSRASESRMRALVGAPKHTLADVNNVNNHMRTALRRFYRQRNILMHRPNGTHLQRQYDGHVGGLGENGLHD